MPNGSTASEIINVVIQTATFRFEGASHFPFQVKSERRISSLLNSEKRFIALENVTITCFSTGKTETVPFIQVNLDQVVYFQPQFANRDSASAEMS
jgi:hypothetical protein